MVIFYQHRVVQPCSMVAAAAHAHRILFQGAMSRWGLASVEHCGSRAFDGLCRTAAHGRHARQPLQEIEGGALARQDSPRWTFDSGHHALLAPRTFLGAWLDPHASIEGSENRL